MNYPIRSEYISSILSAEENFSSLTNLRPVLDDWGQPIISNGNFGIVFKMIDTATGEYWAVKCFTREQEGRKEAYKNITSYLSRIDSKYFISIKYLEYELFVDSQNSEDTEFPVVLMEWVEGLTLDKYIEEYKGNSFVLHDLCVSFSELSKWLCSQDMAHGDLKPDNIIIRPTGEIVLIDYDGMYTSYMKGKKAREIGSVNYRLPSRTINDFSRYIDDLALAAISLNLKAISVIYGILDEYHCNDNFLFSETDYISPKQCSVLQRLIEYSYEDASLLPYISTFLQACKKLPLTSTNFTFCEKHVEDLLKTNEYLIEDNAVKENGLIYSYDGKRLLKFDYEYNNEIDVFIKEGVICICEGAFSSYKANRQLNIHLPKSLRFFSKESLSYKYNILTWDSPWFTYDNGYVYSRDFTLLIFQHSSNYDIHSDVKIIGRNCFKNLHVTNITLPESIRVIKKGAFEDASFQNSLTMPQKLQVIENEAFRSCKGLKTLQLNKNLMHIGEYAFHLCNDLSSVMIPDECQLSKIGNRAFCYCKNLENINFNRFLLEIGEESFLWCVRLHHLILPENLRTIGKSAFCLHDSYSFHENKIIEVFPETLEIPKSVHNIGSSAFSESNFIKELHILGNPKIEACAFSACPNLEEIYAPELTNISCGMFLRCTELKAVHFEKLSKILSNGFADCNELSFRMPDTLTQIEYGALKGVRSIVINDNFNYEDDILYDKDFSSILSFNKITDRTKIKDGVKYIDGRAFSVVPQIIELPNSLTDTSIMEVLSLDTQFVKLPTCRTVDPDMEKICTDEKRRISLEHWKIKAKSYGDSMVYIDEYGVTYSENKKILIKFPQTLSIEKYTILPECIEIADYAFDGWEDCDPECGMEYGGNKLEYLKLPDGLKKIGVSALEGCRKLKDLELPETLEQLGDNSLYGCRSIRQLILPSSLKVLGKYALPAQLTHIYSNSSCYTEHDGCLISADDVIWIRPGILRLKLPQTIMFKGHHCNTYSNCIVSDDGILLWTVPNLETFDFPPGVKVIADGAFNKNNKISKIVIPEGVTKIERYAFNCNQALKSIYLPSTIEHIGDLRTYQGWGRKYVEFYYPKEIHIPKGMKGHFFKLLPGIPESTLKDDIY